MFNISKLCGFYIILVALLSCGKPQDPPSNTPTSNDESRQNLAQRTEKTNEIKAQFTQIRDGIKPAAIFLGDLSDAIKKENVADFANGSHDNVQNILNILQKILREATGDLVTYLPDGSWVIERPLKLPDLSEEFLCPTAKLHLVGKREGDVEGIRLLAIGCIHNIEGVELAYVGVNGKKNIQSNFSLEKVSNLFSTHHVIGDSCTLTTQEKSFELSCKPLSIRSDRANALVNPLYFLQDNGAITAHIQVLVTRTDSEKLILKASLDAKPGEKTNVVVTTKGD